MQGKCVGEETLRKAMKVQLIGLLLWISGTLLANEAQQLPFIEVKSNEEWASVFEKAKTENKLVFVDVYTDWCGYCHQLDEEVYTDGAVIDYFSNNFINVKFDAETEFGDPKVRKFNVSGYPTLLFLTPQQELFQTIGGFVPAPTLIAYGKEVQGMRIKLPLLQERYDSGNISNEEILEYINILEVTEPNRANAIAKAYISNLKESDYLDLEIIWLLSRYQNQINGQPYHYIKDNKSLIIETHGQNEFNDYMSAVYNDNLQLSIKYGDEALLNQLVSDVLKQFLANDQLPRARYTTRALYYGQRGDFDKYKLEVNSYMNNHLARVEKPDFALSTTYDIIENYPSEDMFKFSSTLLQTALEIDSENFELNSIMGYTKGLMGNYKSANSFLEKAKNLADGDEELEILDSLKEAIKMMREGTFE